MAELDAPFGNSMDSAPMDGTQITLLLSSGRETEAWWGKSSIGDSDDDDGIEGWRTPRGWAHGEDEEAIRWRPWRSPLSDATRPPEPTTGEAVAWRWRFIEEDRWHVESTAPDFDADDERGLIVEPLYAHPDRAVEALREAVKQRWRKWNGMDDSWDHANGSYATAAKIILQDIDALLRDTGDNDGAGEPTTADDMKEEK